jgi:hypothetical protein
VEKVSDRRAQANSWMLSVNSAIVGRGSLRVIIMAALHTNYRSIRFLEIGLHDPKRLIYCANIGAGQSRQSPVCPRIFSSSGANQQKN